MKTIGLPISHKENESRRALVTDEIRNMRCADHIYVERGYGEVLGISDREYEAVGCHVVSREEVLSREIICDPKIGDAEYLEALHRGRRSSAGSTRRRTATSPTRSLRRS